MSSRKKRRNAPSPTISHGVQSVSAARPSMLSRRVPIVGETIGAASATLLVPAAMRILVTGGCGFIGSNFIRYILEHYQPESVTNVDLLTYAGSLVTTADFPLRFGDRYQF